MLKEFVQFHILVSSKFDLSKLENHTVSHMKSIYEFASVLNIVLYNMWKSNSYKKFDLPKLENYKESGVHPIHEFTIVSNIISDARAAIHKYQFKRNCRQLLTNSYPLSARKVKSIGSPSQLIFISLVFLDALVLTFLLWGSVTKQDGSSPTKRTLFWFFVCLCDIC